MVQIKNDILIADSGSTKTDWRLIRNNIVQEWQTIGLNPFHTKDIILEKTIKSLKINNFKGYVYFYGSGCSGKQPAEKIRKTIKQIFPESIIEVHSDLYGSALGLCGHKPGIVGILGTGASACLYDGKKIIYQSPSLGYILGDDGSGTNMGKELLRSYFYNQLSEELHDKFSKTYNLSRQELLENVYNKSFPNRYIAQFTKFIADHIQYKEMENIINKCFLNYFKCQITKIPDFDKYDLYFTGSIANIFKDYIKKTAVIYALRIKSNEPEPINGLIKYHLNN